MLSVNNSLWIMFCRSTLTKVFLKIFTKKRSYKNCYQRYGARTECLKSRMLIVKVVSALHQLFNNVAKDEHFLVNVIIVLLLLWHWLQCSILWESFSKRKQLIDFSENFKLSGEHPIYLIRMSLKSTFPILLAVIFHRNCLASEG